MSDIAIRIENLGKHYRLGEDGAVDRHLREVITEGVKGIARQLMPTGNGAAVCPGHANGRSGDNGRSFWALRDVSFNVNRGEVVGIVGRNGAGKSTLLKILARITDPTTGRAEIYGRVGSLLEVGTGFHPELTGRENIFLNGAILGMTRNEVKRKFDEIVEFSGIEKFLGTPVKRYSSGMYVRLAFAVAAHLEPEILIVDEVLAVGDADFQRKCLGKMRDVAGEGRTVLFVSHNMSAAQALCSRGIVLQDGTPTTDGDIDTAVSAYLGAIRTRSAMPVSERTDRAGRGEARVCAVQVCGPDGSDRLTTGSKATFAFSTSPPEAAVDCAFTIYDEYASAIASFASARQEEADRTDPSGSEILRCEIDELPLLPGNYRLNVALHAHGVLQDHLEGALFFTVDESYARQRILRRANCRASVLINHHWIRPVCRSVHRASARD